MPYHITLPLDADPNAPYPAIPHRALSGTLYAWLRAADPGLAVRVHDLPGQKPFTVAPLHRRDDVLYYTCTLLDDTLWPPMQAALEEGATVQIANDRWPVAPSGWSVTHRSYPELVVSSGTETRFAFRFCSPTSFRSQDMHYPLPDPVRAFQSWLLRWNAFAPEQLRLNVNTLDLVSAHVAIGRHRIETRAIEFDRFTQVGFVGHVTYQVIKRRRLSDDLLRRLNILADYAPFCGTGHKTTQGMGHTQRLR
jgi:CRISPR-associated endoribonuclease Cas6